jgi:hypothetical protein
MLDNMFAHPALGGIMIDSAAPGDMHDRPARLEGRGITGKARSGRDNGVGQ